MHAHRGVLMQRRGSGLLRLEAQLPRHRSRLVGHTDTPSFEWHSWHQGIAQDGSTSRCRHCASGLPRDVATTCRGLGLLRLEAQLPRHRSRLVGHVDTPSFEWHSWHQEQAATSMHGRQQSSYVYQRRAPQGATRSQTSCFKLFQAAVSR